MSNELIARIDFELDAWPRSSTLCKTLKDCRAEIERLSKPYVPLTRVELVALARGFGGSIMHPYDYGASPISMILPFEAIESLQSAIIERAGLEVKHD